MEPSGMARPHLSLFSVEQIDQIHQMALHILREVGVRFDSEKARQIFTHSKDVHIDNQNLVKFTPEAVAWALGQAPSSIQIYSRAGELAFNLGADRTRFGIGVTSLYYLEPVTGEVNPFHREHMSSMVRLGDHFPSYDVISTVGVLQDYPPEVADLIALLEMTANTTKPLVTLISEETLFEPALQMLENLHGNLSERPFVIPYFNPISPLTVNAGTVEKMIATIERGLPFIYNAYAMAGVSAPITPAGILAQMAAELLAGLVFSQLVKPGTPIILGMLPTYFDMKTMVSFYDAKSYLISLGCIELLRHYGLPHSGTSGSGNGWMGDLIDYENYWFNHLVVAAGQGGLAPFIGDTMRSKVFSPLNVVYGDEVIRKVLKFMEGITLDPAEFGFDEIAGQGPGGNFLMEPLTLEKFRQAYTISDVFPQYTMDQWQISGQPNPQTLLKEHTRDLIASLPEPDDYAALRQKGEKFIARFNEFGQNW